MSLLLFKLFLIKNKYYSVNFQKTNLVVFLIQDESLAGSKVGTLDDGSGDNANEPNTMRKYLKTMKIYSV